MTGTLKTLCPLARNPAANPRDPYHHQPVKVGGVTVCRDGSIAVTLDDGHQVLKLPAGGTELRVIAGAEGAGGCDGPGELARFEHPHGIAALSDGGLVIADRVNHRLRMVSAAGTVSTLAGCGTMGHVDGPSTEVQALFPRVAIADRPSSFSSLPPPYPCRRRARSLSAVSPRSRSLARSLA